MAGKYVMLSFGYASLPLTPVNRSKECRKIPPSKHCKAKHFFEKKCFMLNHFKTWDTF